MQNELYTCDNLSQCAYLIACGFDPLEWRQSAGGRSSWIFERTEQLDRHSEDFTLGRGMAGVIKRFMQARRRLFNEAAERAS
jgi:ribosomal protein L3